MKTATINLSGMAACLALLCLLASGTTQAQAQARELFTPLPPQQLTEQWSAARAPLAKRLNNIRQRPTTLSLSLVYINVDALGDNNLRMTWSGTAPLDFNKSKVETRSANDFTWYGSLASVPGQAILVVHGGTITGSIRESGNLYRVESVGDGVHAVIKVDPARFPPEHPPSFKERERRGGGSASITADRPRAAGPVGIDILVAYTAAARGAVGDIGAIIQLAMDEANQSYVNSAIGIRLTMVDSFEMDNYTESGKDYDTIVADFVAAPTVSSRRDKSGADLAALVVDQSDYCGMADAIQATEATAFAVVHYDCATGYYSFAHELGHLQGARHDPDSDPTNEPFAWGHGMQYNTAPAWRTIMAYNCPGAGCPRLQYWSNPAVNYNGIPMGTAANNDNARVLNATAGAIAGFRSRPPAQQQVDAVKDSAAKGKR